MTEEKESDWVWVWTVIGGIIGWIWLLAIVAGAVLVIFGIGE